MSRLDCLSNRNIRIIATYVTHKLGSYHALFEELPYPVKEYSSPDDFFMNEDEWTTFDNFNQIFRRAKALVNEPDFYFNCGASSARLRSWGRFHHFVRVFATPSDGFRKLPFFNKNFNNTKEIEIILPPVYDHHSGKIKTILKIQYHRDLNPNNDYIGDPYLQGIISSIPTIWGLAPAVINQVLAPYNPEVLFNTEPEFIPYGLDVKMEGDVMTLNDPIHDSRCTVGETIFLEPEEINGQKVFLGKYVNRSDNFPPFSKNRSEAVLITQNVRIDNQTLIKAGDIFMAPYFILDITYDRASFFHHISQVFKIRAKNNDSGQPLIDTINQLRKSMITKNNAYQALEETNAELITVKSRLDEYARELENRVEKRTAELNRAQQNLVKLNHDLEEKVGRQVVQLERYNALRRYLSPKLTEQILTGGHTFGAEPQRKMMTVVFTDIRGFSGLTDTLEPEEIFHLLGNYLSEMIKIVHHHDGTLNKIVGDGLLIFFGDPVPMADHTERAVQMAIDMQKKVVDLMDDWRQYGHELGIGIGINTGFMTVGNIGPDTHKDYTVIGNQVNVAARLESMARAGEILVSQRVYSKVKDLAELEDAGETKVKGIHNPLKIYKITVYTS